MPFSHDELRLIKKGKQQEARELAGEMMQNEAQAQHEQLNQEQAMQDEEMHYALYQDAEQIVAKMAKMKEEGTDPTAMMQNLPQELQQAVIDVMQNGDGSEAEQHGMEQPQQQEQNFNIPNDTINVNNEQTVSNDEAVSMYDMPKI